MGPALIAAASPLLGGLFDLVDDLFTSSEEKDNAKLKLIELEKSGQLAQIAVNLEQARSESLFVSGGRPAIMWICAAVFAWHFLVNPMFISIISYIAMVNGTEVDFSGLPEFNMDALMTVLMGLLGLGAYRTVEKIKGVATK